MSLTESHRNATAKGTDVNVDCRALTFCAKDHHGAQAVLVFFGLQPGER